MGVAGACPCTMYRYCYIAKPDCPRCQGLGRIVGGDMEGWNAIIVLRAALLAMDSGIPRSVLLEKGLLATKATQVVTGELPSGGAAAAVGRQARTLLIEVGLLPARPARKVLTPSERAERKRAKEAEKERNRLLAERTERIWQERREEIRQERIARRAADEIAAAHPEEFEQERETQEVFIALEDGMPDPSYFVHRAARRVSP